MSLVALANAINDDVHGARASTRIRACRRPSCCCRNACRASGRSTEPRPRRRDVRVAAERRRAAAPLPHAAHDHAAHAVPVERQVRGGGHQRRRRRQLLRSHGGHPIAPRLDAPIRAATSSTCATSAAARCGRRPTCRRGASPSDTSSTFQPEIAIFDAKAEEIATQARDRRLAGARRRGAAAAPRQPRRPRARDRRHQLRRARARAGARRLRAPGVRQAVHRNRIPARARRADLPSPAARLARSGHVGGARAGPRRPRRTGRSNGKPIARSSSAAAARSIGRSRSTAGRCRARPASCSIRSSACASASGCRAGESVRVCFATGIAPDRETARALALTYRDPSTAHRARWRWRSRTRRACAATWTSRTTTRCCSSGWRRA